MSALVPLHFESADVRMILRDGEPWWVLNDVCAILEIANPRNAAQRLDDYQKGVHSMDTLGGRQEIAITNEPGIYALTLSSRKAVAKSFAKWLFTEVLPSIRKFGMYPPPLIDQIDHEDWQDGMRLRLGERFREERLRWEALTGHGFEHVPGFSKSIIRTIEQTDSGARKGNRVEMMALAGMDVLYVLTGQRTVSPTERRVIDYIRQSGDPRSLALLAIAQAA
ncbi:Bro-N domain-containing protein [Sphingomonas cavernae]|nr:BRO family protein [Sphingomonas cavernae]